METFTEAELIKAKRRSRLVLKKGYKSILMAAQDIALFYTESKIVFAIDKDNNKYLCDYNLGELEALLDETIFFRANRQYIINIEYTKAFQSTQRVKLLVDVEVSSGHYPIVISQVTVGEFKKWVNEM